MSEPVFYIQTEIEGKTIRVKIALKDVQAAIEEYQGEQLNANQ